MQYVKCAFQKGASKTYTYHYDGPPLSVGDAVEVATDRGTKVVYVAGFTDEKPKFATKAIKGLAPEKAAAK